MPDTGAEIAPQETTKQETTKPRRVRKKYAVAPSQQVLVALINNGRDLQIAREAHWYRIPVKSAPRITAAARYIAFYQTKIFGVEGWAVRYWAEIRGREIVTRRELFPDQSSHSRAEELYYKLELGEIKRREPAIISRRGRRIVFIPTTWEKFQRATEINDLFHESPLEDELWEAFKGERLEAERQYFLEAGGKTYCLDFALFCQNGKINIECDGDRWHAAVEKIPDDNERNNHLESKGWSVLRFNGKQLADEMPRCLQLVRETANQYGGVVTPEGELRYYALGGEDRGKKLNLFQESVVEYEARKSQEEQEETD